MNASEYHAKVAADRDRQDEELNKLEWLPRFGFTTNDPIKLASALEAIRRRVCCYGPEAERCDCKEGIGRSLVGGPKGGETTGCYELRSAIRLILDI